MCEHGPLSLPPLPWLPCCLKRLGDAPSTPSPHHTGWNERFLFLRQEVDAPRPQLQNKQLEFICGQTPKYQQHDDQERMLGPAHIRDHIFFIPESRKPSQQESSLEVRSGMIWSVMISTHRPWDAHPGTHGRILRYTKYGLRTRQIRTTGQRKPRRNAPQKWIKQPGGVTQSTCASIHILYSFPFDRHSLCRNSFLQSQGARTLSLTSGLVVRIRLSRHDSTSVFGRELKPCL